MIIFFVVGIYLFIRGILALCGQSIFYTKRTLETIPPEQLPTYLHEVGIWNTLTGIVFIGKAILDNLFPNSTWLMIVFIILLLVCVIFLSKCNEKYIKK